MSDFNKDATVEKLIILYIFDKMEIPLQESTVLELCAPKDRVYVPYMEVKALLHQLLEAGFVYEFSKNGGNVSYAITVDGMACVNHFHIKIPASIREEISEYVRHNRMNYRKKQEYIADYFKNKDGTYTVLLKILSPVQPIMELKLTVSKRQTAKWIHDNWCERAPQVYETINEILIE